MVLIQQAMEVTRTLIRYKPNYGDCDAGFNVETSN